MNAKDAKAGTARNGGSRPGLSGTGASGAKGTALRRLVTGVPGLDAVLGGGLPEFSFNLIAGPPGSGKTTLAHQMMFALASAERPALYFTVLGEPAVKMLRYQQQFDFFDPEMVGGAVRFINLGEEAASGDLEQVLARIVHEVAHNDPALVFVDSFRSVVVALERAGTRLLTLQEFVQHLGVLMASWQATTFLIGEYLSADDSSPVFTVADGILWMQQSAHRNSVVRKLEIKKMRGQATLPGLHTFRIDSSGICVFAPVQAPVSASPKQVDSGRRLGTGVDGLDAMLGGGLPQGYSVLVAGPSGSGKSILGAAFLREGVRAGERGVVAVFEQGPGHARDAAFQAMIQEGSIGVVDTRTVGISVDEVAAMVIAEVERLGATRVVIDSLSGFELALAPTFQADFREALARMVRALASTGATVLMTTELEDRYDELRFSPYGTAFLTDAIIVQRYVEVGSRLERMLSVVKVRGSAHSHELRLFAIDEHGIHIGPMLAQHEGLLGGRASRAALAIATEVGSAQPGEAPA